MYSTEYVRLEDVLSPPHFSHTVFNQISSANDLFSLQKKTKF